MREQSEPSFGGLENRLARRLRGENEGVQIVLTKFFDREIERLAQPSEIFRFGSIDVHDDDRFDFADVISRRPIEFSQFDHTIEIGLVPKETPSVVFVRTDGHVRRTSRTN